jgi:hypothetical protein
MADVGIDLVAGVKVSFRSIINAFSRPSASPEQAKTVVI